MKTVYTWVESPMHFYPGHPEHPQRLSVLQRLLPGIPAQSLEVEPASEREVLQVHHPTLVEELRQACRAGAQIIDYAPTFVTSSSFDDALQAAGGVLTCLGALLRREAQNGFAIIRPPGHHAEPGRAMGFCLFNNVAIAARTALAQGIERVLIVDIDAHHGNGTQAAFWDEPRVAYFSTHQWGIYPGSGWIDEAPQARKRIVNVPLPAHSGDLNYRRAFEQLLEPQIAAFRPQLLLVSVGYDAHWKDPLTELGLTYAGYAHLSQRLVDLANAWCEGRILFVLEGGYDAHNLAQGVLAAFAALTSSPWSPPPDSFPYPEPSVEEHLQRIREWHGFG